MGVLIYCVLVSRGLLQKFFILQLLAHSKSAQNEHFYYTKQRCKSKQFIAHFLLRIYNKTKKGNPWITLLKKSERKPD